jgi:phage N-6-adenine-methyltransferase
MINPGIMSSNTDMWATPQWLFDALNSHYHFSLDVCAIPENAKCKKYYTPEQDGLKQKWEGICWMNPPYSKLKDWVEKAHNEALRGITTVGLLPARTDTIAFHKYILPFSGINSSKSEYAYAAGIIDGEGCIRIDKKNPTVANRLRTPTYSLKIQVKMTDYNIIIWLRDIFSCGNISQEQFFDKKNTYKLEIIGEEAFHVIELIYPYLKVKKSQAYIAMLFHEVKLGKVGRHNTDEFLEKQEILYSEISVLKKEIIDPGRFVITRIEFIRGRLRFGDGKGSAPFPSMIVVWGGGKHGRS